MIASVAVTYIVPWTTELEERYFPPHRIRATMADTWTDRSNSTTPDCAYPAHLADIIKTDGIREAEDHAHALRVRSHLDKGRAPS